jgi:hypothetical protein
MGDGMERVDIYLSQDQIRELKNWEEVPIRGSDGKLYALRAVRKKTKWRSLQHIEEVRLEDVMRERQS